VSKILKQWLHRCLPPYEKEREREKKRKNKDSPCFPMKVLKFLERDLFLKIKKWN
jgi:hypothetical protein